MWIVGHGGWVTSLAVGEEQVGDEKVEFLLSGSRDKTLIKWELDTKKDDEPDKEWGKPKKMFTGKSLDSEVTLCVKATLTSSAKSSSPETPDSASQLPGTALSDSGTLLVETPSASSLDIKEMCYQLLFQLMTDKS